jgi:hypothetical protein
MYYIIHKLFLWIKCDYSCFFRVHLYNLFGRPDSYRDNTLSVVSFFLKQYKKDATPPKVLKTPLESLLDNR